MARHSTLRARFALWVALLLLAGLAAFGAFVYYSLAEGLYESIDESLELSVAQVMTTLTVEDGRMHLTESPSVTGEHADELRERGLTIRILGPSGQVFQAYGRYRDMPVAAEDLDFARTREHAEVTRADPSGRASIRQLTTPIEDRGQVVGFIQVLHSLEEVDETLSRLLTALFVGGPALVLFAALGGYALASRALAPIDAITRTARRISAEDLSARLGLPATDDEVGRLAMTFDGMLARLEDSFRRERQFAADASHELRTPLAALQAILSVIRERPRTAEEYREALDDLAGVADRLQSLTENLLRLARSEARPPPVLDLVDLSTLVDDVVEALRPLAEQKGLAVKTDIAAGLRTPGDRDDLIRLMVNLVDNAIRYTEQGTISVTARPGADGARVEVADTGIGIPTPHLARIFDRFYRVDPSRTAGGAGLGLAIARQIAADHAGTIEATSVIGKGATFVVCLPT